MNIEWNRGGSREANLVGGPRDGELRAVIEDEYQIRFVSRRINPNRPEKVEYVEHTYVRDPDSFAFIYAGAVPVPEGKRP